MRNDFETVMKRETKPSSLHFSFGEGFLRSAKLYSALTIGKRSTPLPCYGKRIFSVTPQVGEITTEFAPLWQETIIGKNVAGEGKPYSIFFYGTATLKRSIFTH